MNKKLHLCMLRRLVTKIEVTLTEHTPTYTTLPMHVQTALTHSVHNVLYIYIYIYIYT